jgi:hypothetical protein
LRLGHQAPSQTPITDWPNVYGESDRTGAFVKDKPVRPQELGATIYHALGVPLDLRLGKDGFIRPISSGQPILNLFGKSTRFPTCGFRHMVPGGCAHEDRVSARTTGRCLQTK